MLRQGPRPPAWRVATSRRERGLERGDIQRPMLHVELEKCRCRLSLSLGNVHMFCRFQDMSMLPCYSFQPSIMSLRGHVALSILRDASVALLILGVKTHKGWAGGS